MISSLGFMAFTLWAMMQPSAKIKTKKNPSGRCLYEMNVSFKKGKGPTQERSLMTEAFSQAEARGIFQKQIDRNLKNAQLTKLQIKKVSC